MKTDLKKKVEKETDVGSDSPIDTDTGISCILHAFNQMDITLEKMQADKLFRFYQMLTEWNQVMNLTAITEFEQVVYKHFVDSLCGGKQINVHQGVSVLDVGTGAGFPGIPLKICFPALQITLLDSLQKRVVFLNEVIKTLHLTGIQAIHGRAEDLGRREEHREYYDYVVSRAVADLSVLSEYCMPFVKVGGIMLSYKSGEVGEELSCAEQAIKILGGKTEKTADFAYQVSGEFYHRTIVIIRKEKMTPKKYPRKAGTPGKMPLGR